MLRLGHSSSTLAKLFAARCSIVPAGHQQAQFVHTDEARLAAAKARAPPTGFRPPNPYAVFFKQFFQPGMAISTAGKEAGKKWKTLSADQIQEFQKQAAEIGAKRRQDFEQLPAEEQKALYAKADEARKKRRLREHRAQLREYHEKTNRPVQPPNGYALYVKEAMQGKKGIERAEANRLVSEAAKKWKGMSDEEKKQYNDQSAQLHEEYKTRLEEWSTKKNLDAKQKFVTQTKLGRPRGSTKERSAKSAATRSKPVNKGGRPRKLKNKVAARNAQL
ncbi:Nucleolar transcription factor 1-like protein [Aphelenchoides fujianensis]|nr:Nucleolar transcription factor 1-like protein [Aphelenchoides fujianensis]